MTSPEKAKGALELMSKLAFKSPPHLCFLPEVHADLPLNWISVGQPAHRKVILYFHGGAYLAGSAMSHKAMLGRISQLTGVRICAPDYRLSPQAPFPAAFDDAKTAWDVLLSRGYTPSDIILGGDSAGGGLMLALLASLSQAGSTPAGAFALSPWTDLTLSGASLKTPTEAMLPFSRLEEAVDLYLQGAARNDPRASPLFATFQSPPPVLIQVGKDEALADDARAMANVLATEGGDVALSEWDTALHIFQILDGWVPEARLALRDIAVFVQTSFAIAKR